MRIDGFAWIPDIVEKLWSKHHVDQDEAEEVFFNGPRFWFVENGNRAGEDVYAAMGQTDGGRCAGPERSRHGQEGAEATWQKVIGRAASLGQARSKGLVNIGTHTASETNLVFARFKWRSTHDAGTA
jgi:hypothetical protein